MIVIRFCIFISYLCCFYFTQSQAFAQSFYGPASLGAGQTGRAANDTSEGTFLNPAIIAHHRGYQLNFMTAPEEKIQSRDGSSYGLVITDNSPGILFAASFGYIEKTRKLESGPDLKIQDLTLSVADFMFEKATIGLSYHYIGQTLGNSESLHQNTGHIGFLYTPLRHLGLAFVAYDFVGTRKSVREEFRVRHSYGFGINYVFKEFLILRGDLTAIPEFAPKRRWDSMVGVESLLSEWFVLRWGHRESHQMEQSLRSFGFGFLGPRLSVNYAHQQVVNKTQNYQHSIDLRLPF